MQRLPDINPAEHYVFACPQNLGNELYPSQLRLFDLPIADDLANMK